MTCGCGKLDDNHGDQRNITLADVDQSAEAAGITREQAVHNLQESCDEIGMPEPGPMGHGTWMDQPNL
jgi:hypothetical protein